MKNNFKRSTKKHVGNKTNSNTDITNNNLWVIEDLIKSVVEMPQDSFNALLKSMAKFHKYSLWNQILLYRAGASQVAGFHKWQELNRTVKNWARAIWLLAPMVSVKEKEDGVKEQKIWGFKSVPVFDIGDTEGEEVSRWLTISSKIDLEAIGSVALKLGYTVDFEPLEISTGGYIQDKNITLNSNLSKTENVGTLIHELCHWELGHTTSTDILERSQKEQEAETTTAIVCNILWVERNSQFYLKAWKLDSEIKNSFSKIDKAVKIIISHLDPTLIENWMY